MNQTFFFFWSASHNSFKLGQESRDCTNLRRTEEPYCFSVRFHCFSSFLWRPPFIKVDEKFQLHTFIRNTTTPTARMMCLILVEPTVNFYPSTQRL